MRHGIEGNEMMNITMRPRPPDDQTRAPRFCGLFLYLTHSDKLRPKTRQPQPYHRFMLVRKSGATTLSVRGRGMVKLIHKERAEISSANMVTYNIVVHNNKLGNINN